MVTLKNLLPLTAFLVLALMLPHNAHAQDAQEATTIQVGAPDHANLGERVTVQALLADSTGQPISQATIYFTVPATFLEGSGDMVVAQALTNENGQAVTEFENDLAGPPPGDSQGALTIRAEFRGDSHYEPSDATAQISIAGERQLYAEHVGVQIPDLNAAPPMQVSASLREPFGEVTPEVQALWPSLSGWPIALALMTVWLLFIFVVVLIFRIAALGRQKRAGYNPETGRFE